MLRLPFQTARLSIRNFKPSDWERVHSYGSLSDFTQYEIWGPNTIEDSKIFVNSSSLQANQSPRYQFDLAVCLKENDLLIGSCAIHRAAEQSAVAHIGWAIHPEFQNKGYATEAAQALMQAGFDQFGLALIFATCDVQNIASLKVMERLFMKRVGIIKGTKEIKGKIRDTFRYEIKQAPSK